MGAPVAAAVQISSLPRPQPTAKLRVFVVTITTESNFTKRPVLWLALPEELQEFSTRGINKMLQEQGIYEVVSAGDIQAVLGNSTVSGWEWKANNMALLKDVGNALHSDYALLFERSYNVCLQFDVNLINLETGKVFFVSNYIPTPTLQRLNNDEKKQAGKEMAKISYRQLFSAAKSDFIQTAMSKGKRATEKMKPKETDAPVPTHMPEKPVETLPDAVMPKTAEPRVATLRNTQADFEKELDAVISAKNKKSEALRLIVYDFDAADRLKVVGLILTEALREELHNFGGFLLVNREDILKIMDEYKLQQSGAVVEAQAIKMGKWLAANQAVTGSLGLLGNTSILQVKRIDIKTMGTIALGSLKCPAGREEELLNQMPQLARKLTQ
jgi:hypothetical protein